MVRSRCPNSPRRVHPYLEVLTQRHAPHEPALESPGGWDGWVCPRAGSDSRPFFLIVTGVFKVGGHGRSEKSRDKIDRVLLFQALASKLAGRRRSPAARATNSRFSRPNRPPWRSSEGSASRKVVAKPSTVSGSVQWIVRSRTYLFRGIRKPPSRLRAGAPIAPKARRSCGGAWLSDRSAMGGATHMPPLVPRRRASQTGIVENDMFAPLRWSPRTYRLSRISLSGERIA